MRHRNNNLTYKKKTGGWLKAMGGRRQQMPLLKLVQSGLQLPGCLNVNES